MTPPCSPPLSFSRPRQKARKVRTGCRTCKIRKVKCDEARPSCHRCLATGRVCDGYGVWGGGGNSPSQRHLSHENVSSISGERLSWRKDSMIIDGTALRLIPLHVISADEHICMEWFLYRTAEKLPGAFRSAFWSKLLPQVALSEPAVLHAVLTLGSVHKRQALDVDTSSGSSKADTTELFTLQQYTRATSDLRCRIEDKSRVSSKVTLIACAVFVHLEHLRGGYETALTHLRYGLILLEEILHINGKAEEGSRDVFDEWILQTFMSLSVQAELFGQDVCQPRLFSSVGNHVKPVGEMFRSLGHARLSLEHILLRIVGATGQRHGCFGSAPDDQSSPPKLELSDARTSIQTELDSWLQAFETAISSAENKVPRTACSAVDRFAWKLLRVYHTLACVMVAGCLSFVISSTDTRANTSPLSHPSASCSSSSTFFCGPTSPAFRITPQHSRSPQPDSHSINNTSYPLTPLFTSILAQCEFLFKLAFSPSIQTARLHRRPADRDTSHAIADIGWIPPLYYTAIHGHNHDIRRKAITMLRFVPHREGIWDSLLAATVAEKVLDLERDRHDSSSEVQDQHERVAEGNGTQDVAVDLESEQSSVRYIQVRLPEDPEGRLLLDHGIYSDRDSRWTRGRNVYDLRTSHWDV